MSAEITATELEAHLLERIAEFAELSTEEIDTRRPLEEYGLSSRQAVELSGELEDMLDENLSATMLWEHPTVKQLVTALLDDGPEPGPQATEHSPADEPDTGAIAVVGIGCRFPGDVHSAREFWEMLTDGRDVVTEVPAERWSGYPEQGGDTTRWGGFLDDIAGFDAEFFGIAPREAARMDPQQRMLLEVAWESLEHAGIAPGSLAGSDTGVFVGVSGTEYGAQSLADLSGMDAWAGTGAALSIAANRLSYVLDLRGPSLSVDTACSSSLTALHLAVASLRRGESRAALVGGANLLLGPGVTANFDEMGLTASDGRCKPFSADADGIARSEGAGMVVLKRLAEARTDGDRVLAVIRGSASNSDGRSNGLTAPNPAAQQALLHSACHQAGVEPKAVDYVEAHGTGTLLGDPIEARALATVFTHGRDPEQPLLFGSVKSNLGHAEAAAGIAGLIKVVLGLHHGMIPASLHYDAPNPYIDFATLGLAVADRPQRWPDDRHPALAGVSGFGFGGTNAHVVLEQADTAAPARTTGPAREPRYRWLLGAASRSRLAATARQLADFLADAEADSDPADVGHTLARRLHGSTRAGIVGSDSAELIRGLHALADGRPAPQVITGTPAESAAGPLFVYSGHGSQWTGMARRLLETEPAFAAAVDRLDGPILAETGHSLRADIETATEPATMDRVQPQLYGIQLALTELWRWYGVEPSAVLGHSFGEVTAAVVAGALSESDGARIVALRSRLLASVAGNGAMALLELGAADARSLVDSSDGVDIAVLSGPSQTVVAGEQEQVRRIVSEVDERGLLAKMIKLDVAAHSPIVEPVIGQLRTGLADLVPGDAGPAFYSTSLPDPRERPSFDAAYWADNLRNPVRLAGAVSTALVDGYRTFVEISPHPILHHALADNGANLVLHSTKSDTDEVTEFHRQLAAVELAGHAATTCGRLHGTPDDRRLLNLPTTPWRHSHHWLPNPAPTPTATHPLLGTHVEVPGSGTHVFSADLGSAVLPWLSDHELDGRAVLPAAAYVELASAAMRHVTCLDGQSVEVRELAMHAPLPLAEHSPVSTTLQSHEQHSAEVTVHTKQGGGWQLHASAEVWSGPVDAAPPEPAPVIGAVERPAMPAAQLHATLEELGIRYGPTFHTIGEIACHTDPDSGETTAHADLTPREQSHAPSALMLRTILLDASMQLVAGALLHDASGQSDRGAGLYLPVALGSVRVYRDPSTATALRGRVQAGSASRLFAHVQLIDEYGSVVVSVDDIALTEVERAAVRAPLTERLLRARWQPAEPAEPVDAVTRPGSLLVASSGVSPLAGAVAARAGSGTREVDYHDTAELATMAATGGFDAITLVLPRTPAAGHHALAEAERAVLAVATATSALTENAPQGRTTPRLCLVTSGATVLDETEQGKPAFAALRGLVRVLAYEHPELRPSIVDLDPAEGEERRAAAVLTEVHTGHEDEVAWRRGARHVLRLEHTSLARTAPLPSAAHCDGGYVITGGLGGLGLLLARWLAEQGAGKIVLNGRSEPGAAAQEEIDAIRAAGTDVEVVHGDVAEPGVAETLIERACSPGKVRGVLHAAAVFGDRTTGMLDAATLQDTWRAKAYGALRLHEATLDCALDWWVGFSSAAALHGLPGQPAYACANAYLDALVSLRRARGLPALSVSWGTWSEVGAAADTDIPWLRPIAPDEALEVLARALAADRNGLGALRLDLDQLTAAFGHITQLPLFAELMNSRSVDSRPRTDDDTQTWAGLARVRELDADSARAAVTAQLRTRIASVLGFDVEALDVSTPLPALGVDSLLAVRIRNAVQHDFECALPVSLLLRGANVAETEQWLCETLGVVAPPAEPSGTRTDPAGDEPVLIPPRDAAERLVASAWQEVLGVKVGVTQDFYAIGGTPDTAEAVTALLVERSGTERTVSELFELPSVERMAQHFREDDRDAEQNRSPLRVLRAEGSADPLFVFHPGGGDTAVYRQLVALLDPELPVYGFDRLEGVPDVEQRALRYLPELRAIQPHGPYRLAGWSFGGFLAYEMAQLLRRAGERVELVAMMDPILPLPDPPGLSETQLLARRFERFGEFLETSYGKRVDLPYEQLARLDEEGQVQLLVDTMRAAGLVNSAVSDAILHHQRTSFLDARALERYRPEPYDGRVVYFSAAELVPGGLRDQRFDRTDPARGWDEVCADIEVITVSGHHQSMLDPPHVDQIGKQLDNLLETGNAATERQA